MLLLNFRPAIENKRQTKTREKKETKIMQKPFNDGFVVHIENIHFL